MAAGEGGKAGVGVGGIEFSSVLYYHQPINKLVIESDSSNRKSV